jgi:hypothetical protein
VHGSNSQAFISYSRADLRFVENLAREFRHTGIATWVDVENLRPGDRWEPAIRVAIRSSRAFVFCISPLSVASGNTFVELKAALSLGLIVFPVMIEPTSLDSLPEALRELQIIQLFRDPPSIACKRAAAELARLLGLPTSAGNGFAADHDTIDALIIRVGACNRVPAPQDFLPRDFTDGMVVLDREVASLGSAALTTIAEWLNRCGAVYIVVGEGPASDEIGALSGAAFAVLGRNRLNFVCTPDTLPIAAKLADLFQARLIKCFEEEDGEAALANSLGAK